MAKKKAKPKKTLAKPKKKVSKAAKKKTLPKQKNKKSIKTEKPITRARDVLARKNLDGSVSIMRLDNDRFFFTIDGIAAEFWNLIDGKCTKTEITEKLIEKFSPPIDRFSKDVNELIMDLKKEKLINT